MGEIAHFLRIGGGKAAKGAIGGLAFRFRPPAQRLDGFRLLRADRATGRSPDTGRIDPAIGGGNFTYVTPNLKGAFEDVEAERAGLHRHIVAFEPLVASRWPHIDASARDFHPAGFERVRDLVSDQCQPGERRGTGRSPFKQEDAAAPVALVLVAENSVRPGRPGNRGRKWP